MSRAKQPVNINGIEFDALIEQSISYEANVPEYATEKGFSVSDNISLKPETLAMTLYVTDTPVTWKNRFGSDSDRVNSVVKQLEELFFSKQIVSVVTSDAVYDNLAITSLSISKSSETGYAREIPISLKKIIVTESSTVSLPSSYGKSGATEAPAGSANTSSGRTASSTADSSREKSGSILYNAAKSIGIID